jgi:hypothetical protein
VRGLDDVLTMAVGSCSIDYDPTAIKPLHPLEMKVPNMTQLWIEMDET